MASDPQHGALPCSAMAQGDLAPHAPAHRGHQEPELQGFGGDSGKRYGGRRSGAALSLAFERHRVVLTIDVKASLCVIAPPNSTLHLDSILPTAERAITALVQAADSVNASGVALSVVVQGSRVSDVRVLMHDEELTSESLHLTCLRLGEMWAVVRADIMNGEWWKGEGRRATLQDLVLNAASVLDGLGHAALPTLLVLTDG
eukprot:CAMPEP_0114162006 /NCGR_PEP_ID=MMETSP0043_2-20121206/29262_1 /TAXON_ID=464988 /ORGANISM="Hemiselmis andersenii, Strain CCMP644" /LENGTH=201 /DNA_ID=CAMNT_0001258287 /DNA_START=154 /DNA_END=756 /DNA_ORIENTATION=+